jgi:uncharacterized protein
LNNISFKKIIIALSLACVGGLAFSIDFSHSVVNKFFGRPVYSSSQLEEQRLNRLCLFNELQAQSVTIKTEDNIILAGLLLIREGAHRNVVICHGYRMAKECMLNIVEMLPADNILLFDFRGHGQSQGSQITLGFDEKKDIAAALAFLQQHEKTKQFPTFGIGVSMGAVSLLGAVSDGYSFKGLVLDSIFMNLEEQAERILAKRYKVPRFLFKLFGQIIFKYYMPFSMDKVNTLEWIKHIDIPILMIHSAYDTIVSWVSAQKVYEEIGSQKELWIVDASGHARMFSECSDEYCKRLNSFFNAISA